MRMMTDAIEKRNDSQNHDNTFALRVDKRIIRVEGHQRFWVLAKEEFNDTSHRVRRGLLRDQVGHLAGLQLLL